MIINERKVNLAEKDIEQWLWENPQNVPSGSGAIKRWIKRQYKVPSGVVDLVGISESGQIVVVEIKNVAIDASALTQVCRYAEDIDYIYQCAFYDVANETEDDIRFWVAEKMVIGRSYDNLILLEAEALGVNILSFDVSLSLSFSSSQWTHDFRDRRITDRRELSKDPDWHVAAREYIDAWHQYHTSNAKPVAPLLSVAPESNTE